MKNKTKKRRIGTEVLCRCALLSAACIVLSAVEAALPDFPFVLPGFKLGLSNIAVMAAIDILGGWGALCVAVVKSGFILLTRGFSGAVMSFCGGILSLAVMFLITRLRKPSFGCIGVAVAGAFAHNTGQLIAACFLVSSAVYSYFVILSVISVLTGTLTGLAYGIIYNSLPIDKLRNT